MNEDEQEATAKLMSIGFEHIRKSLGYKKGNLTLETDEGKMLAHAMGVLVQSGIEDSDEFVAQEANLLENVKYLIRKNRAGVNTEDTMFGP